jgi:hypothetical protein
MKTDDEVKRELEVEMEALKARIARLQPHELLKLPQDVCERIALLQNKTGRAGSVPTPEDIERAMELERFRKKYAYMHEQNDQSTARDITFFVRFVLGFWRGIFENFFDYVLLMFQRLRSGTGAAPSLTSLYRLFDWWPTKKLRERSQEMIVEAQVRITMFHKKGRTGLARWIKFCTVVRCVWMVVKGPVTMVFSAVRTYFFGKPG